MNKLLDIKDLGVAVNTQDLQLVSDALFKGEKNIHLEVIFDYGYHADKKSVIISSKFNKEIAYAIQKMIVNGK